MLRIGQFARLSMMRWGCVCAALLGGMARAEAQPKPAVSPSETRFTERSPASAKVQPVSGAAVVGAKSGCTPRDYFIVSSRHCSRVECANGDLNCLRYYHSTHDGCLTSIDRPSFFNAIDPNRPVCFVIHGSYHTWDDARSESQLVNAWLCAAAPDSPVQLVFYTWPSGKRYPFFVQLELATYGRRSSLHSLFLARVVAALPREQKVCIMGHSHGARMASAAAHLLGGGEIENGDALPQGTCAPDHIRLVLLAPAIDHHWLNPGERYGQAMFPTERLMLVRNSKDFTLGAYRLRKPFAPRALGRNGFGSDDLAALGELAGRIVDMDVVNLLGYRHPLRDYYGCGQLAKEVVPCAFFGDDAATTVSRLDSDELSTHIEQTTLRVNRRFECDSSRESEWQPRGKR